ncbi:hypothetical protein GGR28_003433 [Lewinella aquimaris]|uniref:Apea-like HEPN domain-containing protein n=1 Tax=Neolewinella aquimaris TaxID=1835722 RepID=A0A840EFV0_9BACT|nr:HEPN domain-containing protein [Neolewinella aquimaris]MBB4080798.1 hypothetical protein [Neolewinella aquimaris]
MSSAIDEGVSFALETYDKLKAKNFDLLYLPKHDEFPSMSQYNTSGLPHFSITPSYYGSKISYAKIIDKGLESNSITSWNKLKEYIHKSDEFEHFYEFKDLTQEGEEKKQLTSFVLFNTLKGFIDSLIHQLDNPRNKTQKRRKLEQQFLNSFKLESLEYDVLVPIILYQPVFNNFKFDDNTEIVKIDDKLQLARNYRVPDTIIANKEMISAATHAVLIKQKVRRVSNANRWDRSEQVSSKIQRLYSHIDKVFACLRIAMKMPLGYCQILAVPKNFGDNYQAELIGLSIFGRDRYPRLYTRDDLYTHYRIDHKTLNKAKKLYKVNFKSRNLNYAIDKLLDSDSRIRDEDGIIDISSAFESLLSDSTNNLKYKISLRAAVICKFFPVGFTPVEVKRNIGVFYDLRSGIVHGNKKSTVDSKRMVSIGDQGQIKTYTFGKYILTHILETVILNPKWIEVQFIDENMLK